jgi:phage terminase small subunit
MWPAGTVSETSLAKYRRNLIMSNQNLTPNQDAFCENRFRHPELTAAECYKRAYPRCRSEKAAAVEASKSLKKPKIKKYIEELSKRVTGHAGLYPGRILREEARLAFYDLRDLVDPVTGDILPLKDLPEHMSRAIVSLKVIKTQSLKDPELVRTEYHYKFADKGKALERLSRYLGMYEKDNQQKPAPEKTPDRWVWMPTDRELTLAEWSQQVEELNRLEAEKREKRNTTLSDPSNTLEKGIYQ